jgi:hypothetical protein
MVQRLKRPVAVSLVCIALLAAIGYVASRRDAAPGVSALTNMGADIATTASITL